MCLKPSELSAIRCGPRQSCVVQKIGRIREICFTCFLESLTTGRQLVIEAITMETKSSIWQVSSLTISMSMIGWEMLFGMKNSINIFLLHQEWVLHLYWLNLSAPIETSQPRKNEKIPTEITTNGIDPREPSRRQKVA
ncbi:uncharacterized protein LOC129749325 [Uranotaenia lowii]|uniref:uncharacterized protein LOC129749325 n=1 Tax=Uranotaenia lowii TaxID=190385 RepID=UPI0024797C9A|nr:uncharacterized protein LOC129749325 [Uranotaenia lowii]